jgi:hypothetical protein
MKQALSDCDIFEPFNEREYIPELEKLADDHKFPYKTQGSE